jgi:hypothetical protein
MAIRNEAVFWGNGKTENCFESQTVELLFSSFLFNEQRQE